MTRLQRGGLMAMLAAGLSAGCAEGAGRSGPSGGVQLEIAPLDLPGIADAVWDIQVQNNRTPTPDQVWSARITSSRYGDGAGSASYVGTCDADEELASNTVTVNVIGIYTAVVDPSSVGDYGDAAPPGGEAFNDPGPLTRTFVCVPNEDVPVQFDVMLARPAQQGFFDVAVELDDLFCSAKLDCVDGEGQPLRLLHDASGARNQTAVLALACTGGSNAATVLYMDEVNVTCQGGAGPVSVTVDPSGVVGNQGARPPVLYQHQIIRGTEQLGTYHKAYWNLLLGLDLAGMDAAGLHDCALRAQATASDGGFDQGYSPAGTAWPRVDWDVNLTGAAGALSCARHALDGGDGVAVVYGPTAGERWCYGYDPDFLGTSSSPGVADLCAAQAIFCAATVNGSVATGDHSHVFTAAECGGEVPGATFEGLFAGGSTDATTEDWTVFDPSEQAAGIAFWARSAANTYSLAAVFVDAASVATGDVVVCRYDNQGNPGTGGHTHTWSASECGGTLPDAGYTPVLSRSAQCGRDEDWKALRADEPAGPGISFWLESSCAGATWSATYLKNSSALLDNSITCAMTSSSASFGNGAHTHTWTAAECGGSLPGPSHRGVWVKAEHCGRDTNWEVLDDGDAAGPGFSFRLDSACDYYNIEVLYLDLQ